MNQDQMARRIGEILWEDWDPIGIKNIGPRSEYDGYIPPIFDLKLSGADRDAIAFKLRELEESICGVEGSWIDVEWWQIK